MQRLNPHDHHPHVTISGGPFTCRSFHGADGRYRDQYGDRVENTLDRLFTCTLPVIAFGAELAGRIVEVTRIVVL